MLLICLSDWILAPKESPFANTSMTLGAIRTVYQLKWLVTLFVSDFEYRDTQSFGTWTSM